MTTKCCFLCKLSAPLYQWTQAGKMLIHCKKINKIEEEKEDCKMFDGVTLQSLLLPSSLYKAFLKLERLEIS